MATERIFTSYGLCHIARSILFNLESSEIINFRLVCKSLKREIDKPEMWLEKDKSNKSIWNRVFQELSASLDDIDLKSKLALLLCSISQKSNLNHNYLIYPLCIAFRKKNYDLTKEILHELGTPKIMKLIEKTHTEFGINTLTGPGVVLWVNLDTPSLAQGYGCSHPSGSGLIFQSNTSD